MKYKKDSRHGVDRGQQMVQLWLESPEAGEQVLGKWPAGRTEVRPGP